MDWNTICFWFLYIGIIQAVAVIFTFLTVLNDYGINLPTLYKLETIKGYFPNDNDIYDTKSFFNGNSQY